jgi:hypothetical protein
MCTNSYYYMYICVCIYTYMCVCACVCVVCVCVCVDKKNSVLVAWALRDLERANELEPCDAAVTAVLR